MIESHVVPVPGHPAPVEGQQGVDVEAVEVPGDDAAEQFLPPPLVGIVLQFGVSDEYDVLPGEAELHTGPVELVLPGVTELSTRAHDQQVNLTAGLHQAENTGTEEHDLEMRGILSSD